MKMFKNKKTFIYVFYLLIMPILLCSFSLAIAHFQPFDYSKTLITNVVESLDESQRVIFKIDSKKEQLKNWEEYANVFNRDFYGENVLFRVSNKTFTIQNQTQQIAFSDIKQSDVRNNIDHNFSSLKLNQSMKDFSENSIIIGKPLATEISANIGDILRVESNQKEFEFTIFDIYEETTNQKRYINNSYLEFNNPICFISSTFFNELTMNYFDGYVSIGSYKKYINPTYYELNPLLSDNHANLVVSDLFSTNDLILQNLNLKTYQERLFNSYQNQNSAFYYIFIAFLVVFLAGNLLITCKSVYELINHKFIYKHSTSLCFAYALFVILVSIVGVLLLKKFFTLKYDGVIALYYSLSVPLIGLTIFVILQVSFVALSAFITHKKLLKDKNKERVAEIKRLQEKNDKVIFVTGSLTRGGAEKVIVELANYYASLGRKVDIVILLNNQVSWELNKNIRVVNFTGTTNSRIKRIHYWLSSLKNYFNKNYGATIVSFLVRVNILVLLTAKKENHKIIVSERNDPRFDGRGLIVSSFTSFLYPSADKIVFQTNECREMFASSIQSKGVVISNPITIKKYASLMKFDDNLLISAGRISKQKDQITMIKAMKIVALEYPQVHLDIYGDGPLTEKLKEKIKKYELEKNVEIHPNIPNINDKVLEAKAYVSTSLYEGMSNSLMEASFAGVPCIATQCLGTDFIKEDVNGHFIPYQSPRKLANVIIDLYANKESYNRLRERTINIAKKAKFDDIYVRWKDCIDDE